MSVVHATDADFSEVVEKSDVPVVIDFWASWCMPCQRFGPIFEDTAKDFDGKVKFVKISTEEAEAVAQKLNIMSIPCVVMFKDGKEVDRFLGMKPKEELASFVEKSL